MPQPSRHFVIYIPGLGDGHPYAQRIAVSLWRVHRVTPLLFRVGWADGEDFAPKFERLLNLIDRLHDSGKYRVSLVAASAGASAALNAFAARQASISGVVCICGKILHAETISEATRRHNPAYDQSMQQLAKSLEALTPSDRKNIISIHPLYDEMVPVGDTLLPGAITDILPTRGHALSIGLGITVYAGKVLGHLKRLTAK